MCWELCLFFREPCNSPVRCCSFLDEEILSCSRLGRKDSSQGPFTRQGKGSCRTGRVSVLSHDMRDAGACEQPEELRTHGIKMGNGGPMSLKREKWHQIQRGMKGRPKKWNLYCANKMEPLTEFQAGICILTFAFKKHCVGGGLKEATRGR